MTPVISLLGDVALRPDPQAAPRRLSSRQARVVLALLTLERERGVTNDALAEAVWDGRPPSSWPSALRGIISRIRRFMAVAVPGKEGPLVWAGARYRLHFPPGSEPEVDIERAEGAVRAARDALASGTPADARRLAGHAAGILRAPFLPDHDGDWVAGVRARLDEQLLVALEDVSRSAAALGETAEAVAAAAEAVRRAPLRESSHRCLMLAQAVAGNRSEALRTYQRLRVALEAELGIDPSHETEATYLGLLGPAGPTGVPAGEDRRAEAAVLLGRDSELATITGAWREAAAGVRQTVVITGVPGIGKTHLVREAARRISADGVLVLFGSCDRPGGGERANLEAAIPYRPFVGLLDGYLAAARPRLDQLGRRARVALAAVMPSLGDEPGATVPGRSTLFDAITRVIVGATDERPVLAVLDDLQWADEGTLLLLRHVVRHTDGCRLMVVAVARGAPGRRHRLAALSTAPGVGPGLHHLHVEGLAWPIARTLARRHRRGTDDGPAVHPSVLADRCRNPLLLIEAARGQATPRLRDLVAEMLDGLDPLAADVVRAASVVEGVLEPDLLAHVAGCGEHDAREALADAGVAGLVEAISAGGDGHCFTHHLVGQAVHELLGPARRRRLHGRWADAIEELRDVDRGRYAAALARHRLAAGVPGGDRRAALAARRAAQVARERGDHAEAARLAGAALAHLPGNDDLRRDLLTDQAVARTAAGEDRGEHALLDAAVAAAAHGRPDLVARCALALADLARIRPDRTDAAVALLEECLSGPLPAASARMRMRAADARTVRARLAARLIELAGPDHVPAVVDLGAAADHLLGHLGTVGGPRALRQRGELARELGVLAATTGCPRARIAAAHHRAMAAATSLRSDEHDVRRWLADAVDARRSPTARALLTEHAVTAAVTAGALDHAMALAGALPAASRDDDTDTVGRPPPGAMVGHQLVVAGWLRGDRVLAPASGGDEGDELGQAEAVLALIRAGETGRAALAARTLESRLGGAAADDRRLHTLGLLALAAADLDDRGLAADLTCHLTPFAHLACGVGYRSFAGTARLHLGRLAAVVHDRSGAERHLAAAVTQLTARAAGPWLTLARDALASVIAARDRASDLAWIPTLLADVSSPS